MSKFVQLGSLITPAKTVRANDGEYPVLSMTMHDGIVLQADRFKKSLASVDQSNYKVVYKGQLVVGFPIDEGVLYIQNILDEGIMSPAYNVWDVNFTQINPKFLELSLHGPRAMQYYKSKLRGTTARRRSITNTDLLALTLSLPNLEEQSKIVGVIAIIAKLIKMKKEQVSLLDLLIKSRFIEMFGDPVSNTKNLPVIEVGEKCFVTKLAGFEYTNYIKYQDSGDVIMIRGLNVKDKKLKLDEVYYIDNATSDKLQRSKLKENDIVMTYVGVNIGDVAIVDAKNKYHLAPNVAKISPYDGDEINSVFFVYLLDFNKENFAGNATNTAKQALNMEKIRKLQIMLPPIDLQNQFADFVEQVNKSKLEVQKSLEELETLKKSLMQQYFG